MKFKTSELTGAALDWAVAVALGKSPVVRVNGIAAGDRPISIVAEPVWVGWKNDVQDFMPLCYSTNWAQGGPLVGQLAHFVEEQGPDYWAAMAAGECGYGPTPLIAICRAVVASKLGEEVEVPDELGGAA